MRGFFAAIIALACYTPAGALVIATVPHDLVSLTMLVPVLVMLSLFCWLTAELIYEVLTDR